MINGVLGWANNSAGKLFLYLVDIGLCVQQCWKGG